MSSIPSHLSGQSIQDCVTLKYQKFEKTVFVWINQKEGTRALSKRGEFLKSVAEVRQCLVSLDHAGVLKAAHLNLSFLSSSVIFIEDRLDWIRLHCGEQEYQDLATAWEQVKVGVADSREEGISQNNELKELMRILRQKIDGIQGESQEESAAWNAYQKIFDAYEVVDLCPGRLIAHYVSRQSKLRRQSSGYTLAVNPLDYLQGFYLCAQRLERESRWLGKALYEKFAPYAQGKMERLSLLPPFLMRSNEDELLPLRLSGVLLDTFAVLDEVASRLSWVLEGQSLSETQAHIKRISSCYREVCSCWLVDGEAYHGFQEQISNGKGSFKGLDEEEKSALLDELKGLHNLYALLDAYFSPLYHSLLLHFDQLPRSVQLFQKTMGTKDESRWREKALQVERKLSLPWGRGDLAPPVRDFAESEAAYQDLMAEAVKPSPTHKRGKKKRRGQVSKTKKGSKSKKNTRARKKETKKEVIEKTGSENTSKLEKVAGHQLEKNKGEELGSLSFLLSVLGSEPSVRKKEDQRLSSIALRQSFFHMKQFQLARELFDCCEDRDLGNLYHACCMHLYYSREQLERYSAALEFSKKGVKMEGAPNFRLHGLLSWPYLYEQVEEISTPPRYKKSGRIGLVSAHRWLRYPREEQAERERIAGFGLQKGGQAAELLLQALHLGERGKKEKLARSLDSLTDELMEASLEILGREKESVWKEEGAEKGGEILVLQGSVGCLDHLNQLKEALKRLRGASPIYCKSQVMLQVEQAEDFIDFLRSSLSALHQETDASRLAFWCLRSFFVLQEVVRNLQAVMRGGKKEGEEKEIESWRKEVRKKVNGCRYPEEDFLSGESDFLPSICQWILRGSDLSQGFRKDGEKTKDLLDLIGELNEEVQETVDQIFTHGMPLIEKRLLLVR